MTRNTGAALVPDEYPLDVPFETAASNFTAQSSGTNCAGQESSFELTVVQPAELLLPTTGGAPLEFVDPETAELLDDAELMSDLAEAEEDSRQGRMLSGDEVRRQD